MNTYRLKLIGLSLILVLLLAACAQPAVVEEAPAPPVVDQPITEEPIATEAPQATEPPTEDPTIEATDQPTLEEPEAPDDEDEQMKALISEKIGGCHMLNFILSQNKTAEEWSTTIDRMIGKGADVNAEEKELIIDWLVSREQ